MATYEERLAAVEDRLSALERPGHPPAIEPDATRWWLLDRVARRTGPGWEAGALALGGAVQLSAGRRLTHQVEHPVQAVLDADLEPAAAVLAALGHPVRLLLLQALLRGASSLSELLELPGIGTSGQVNHHLRELRAAGLVTTARRNTYSVPAERTVPLLLIIAAALGPQALDAPPP